jgi:hypothetical protein
MVKGNILIRKSPGSRYELQRLSSAARIGRGALFGDLAEAVVQDIYVASTSEGIKRVAVIL